MLRRIVVRYFRRVVAVDIARVYRFAILPVTIALFALALAVRLFEKGFYFRKVRKLLYITVIAVITLLASYGLASQSALHFVVFGHGNFVNRVLCNAPVLASL